MHVGVYLNYLEVCSCLRASKYKEKLLCFLSVNRKRSFSSLIDKVRVVFLCYFSLQAYCIYSFSEFNRVCGFVARMGGCIFLFPEVV